MTGLILELQRSCDDSNLSVEALLRKMKIAAAKLDISILEDWVGHELSGYSGGMLPNYRILKGDPVAENPIHGWIPVLVQDPQEYNAISTAFVSEPVASLTNLLAKNGSGPYYFPIPNRYVTKLNMRSDFKTTKMAVQLGSGGVVKILDAVRNKILDWSLEMEKHGIMGCGYSFNEEEKISAKNIMTTYNINNNGSFAGNIGQENSSGDIMLTTSNLNTLTAALRSIREVASNLVEAGADKNLVVEIDGVLAEASKTNPDKVKLKNGVFDIRAALSGAAGNLTAAGALSAIGQAASTLGIG